MTRTFQITCTPKEGYVANRQNIETKEIDEENKYTFIKQTKTDEMWLVCIRGANAGEAIKESEINSEEWIVMEFENWDEIVEAYYADFGGFGSDKKICPMDLDALAEEIAQRIRSSYDNEVEPTITMQQMSREEFMRRSNRWNSVYDVLRKTPKKFMKQFLQKQKGE